MLEKNTEKLPKGELKSMMETVSAEISDYEGKDRILTDDKAPVELLGMKVLDEIMGKNWIIIGNCIWVNLKYAWKTLSRV